VDGGRRAAGGLGAHEEQAIDADQRCLDARAVVKISAYNFNAVRHDGGARPARHRPHAFAVPRELLE